jgi:hypothetical protein
VPVGSVRSRLDWASTTVALAMSDIANTTMPKIFLIVELLSLRLNLLDPRLRQRKRAYGSSVDLPCWPGQYRQARAEGRSSDESSRMMDSGFPAQFYCNFRMFAGEKHGTLQNRRLDPRALL